MLHRLRRILFILSNDCCPRCPHGHPREPRNLYRAIMIWYTFLPNRQRLVLPCICPLGMMSDRLEPHHLN